VNALPQEFADDNSYFVITPERPQRIRREVQLFRDWLVAVASGGSESPMSGVANVIENRSRRSADN
jgi:hypothetical protein